MTAFEIVRDSVDIVDAAGCYGIEVNRHRKALCPFHDDRNPSLSFKGQRFKCFSCGAGGDVIDLVGHLANLPPLDTVRELNDMFSLRIDVDKPVSSSEIAHRKQLAEEKRAFAEWEKRTHGILADYFRMLRGWRVEYAPRHPDQDKAAAARKAAADKKAAKSKTKTATTTQAATAAPANPDGSGGEKTSSAEPPKDFGNADSGEQISMFGSQLDAAAA